MGIIEVINHLAREPGVTVLTAAAVSFVSSALTADIPRHCCDISCRSFGRRQSAAECRCSHLSYCVDFFPNPVCAS